MFGTTVVSDLCKFCGIKNKMFYKVFADDIKNYLCFVVGSGHTYSIELHEDFINIVEVSES